MVINNARRLHEDAILLHDMERYPTAYSISILAQEEFGKAFMLHLATEGKMPWNDGLQKAFRSHSCKQLVALIMAYLERNDWDWIDMKERYNELYRGASNFPDFVIDAVHIIVLEYVKQFHRMEWLDSPGREIDPQANRIAKGILDREKQTGFYISIGNNGTVTREPNLITESQSKEELERTEKVSKAIGVVNGKLIALSVEVDKIMALFQVLSGTMTVEEFNNSWW
ncbi:MAG: AbiV family abortive infection protein [Clostridiaceae bacterium]|nr:AbiV family abortive infection protein [Clostridiaceae bacterium]